MKKLLFLFAGCLLFSGTNAQGFEDFNEWFADGGNSSPYTNMDDGSVRIAVTDACDPWSVNFSNIFTGVSGQTEGNTFTLSFDVMWNGEGESTSLNILTGKLNCSSPYDDDCVHDDYQWVAYNIPDDGTGNTELLYYDEYGELQNFWTGGHNKAFAINEGEWTHIEWGGIIGEAGASYIGIQIDLGANDGSSVGDFYFKNIKAQFGTNTLSYFEGIINTITSDLEYEIANGEATVIGTNLADDQTSVNIPATITIDEVDYPVVAIGRSAFANCTNLTEITIPNTVTSIGANAFEHCESLAGITISSSVESIGASAFNYCTSLSSVNIPATVLSIGRDPFEKCYGLTSITVDNANPYYSSADGVLFNKYKTELKCCPAGKTGSYTVPSTVTSLAYAAFSNCTQIEDVILPDGLESIGQYAFYDCQNMESIIIPESVYSIANGAFGNCDNTLTIYCETCTDPYSWEEDWNGWNGGCNVNWAYGAWSLSEDGVLTISKDINFSSANYYPWYSIKNSIKSVVVEEGVATIGYRAFRSCSNLETVTLPNTITYIHRFAFHGCSGLQYSYDEEYSAKYLGVEDNPYFFMIGVTGNKSSFAVHDDCKLIADGADYDNSLSSVEIPETVEYIGDDAFANTNIVYYTGSASGNPWGARAVNAIVDGDFIYADEDQTILVGYTGEGGDIEIPGTVTVISDEVFFNRSDITSVDLSQATGLTDIGEYAFSGCFGITSIDIPNTVTSIGAYAFDNTGLTSVAIPSSVVGIYEYAFSNCPQLSSVDFSNATNLQFIGEGAFYYSNLETVEIPESVVTIGESAFAYCTNLQLAVIPSSVEYVGSYAFSRCYYIKILCESDWSYIDYNWNYYWNSNSSGDIIYNYKSLSVNVYANNEEYGAVEGSGYYEYGTDVKLTATANEGYTFLRWSDGVDDNPRTITVSGYYNYFEAIFADESDNVYTVTLNVNNPDYGTVYGAGKYVEGDYVNLSAISAMGCSFVKWSNGSTSSSPSFYIYEDITLTAEFAINTYNINISAENGTIDGAESGSYDYGTELTLTAIPDDGYKFVQWNDTYNNNNPRTLTVTSDRNISALFIVEHQEVSEGENYVYAMGNETDNGVFVPTETATYTITTDSYRDTYGHLLDAEGNILANDDDSGEDQNFRIVYELTEGETYYIGAGFYSDDYSGYLNLTIKKPITITATAKNGTVSGAGTFNYKDNITLVANADEGYKFVRWSDGFSNNLRSITVTYDMDLEAIFAEEDQNVYSIVAYANYNGYAYGGGDFVEGEDVTITAVPYSGYHFVRWNDGETDNPRTITVSEDSVFVAEFAINTYTVTVIANNDDYGYVVGTGTYGYGNYVELDAYAYSHCYFNGWEDGYVYNSRSFWIYQDTTFIVNFEIEHFNVLALPENSSQGSVEGSGSYAYGSTATLTATGATGYHFLQWSDGNTHNPREITISNSVYFTAEFEINTYTVTVDPELENGTITLSGTGQYTHGSEATFNAIPKTNYQFVRWSDLKTDDEITVVVTRDMVLSAVFCESDKEIFTVQTNATNGSVTGASNYISGETAIFTATADNGYHFTKWSTDDTDNPFSKKITKDQTITAYFEINTYAVKVEAGAHGSVEVKKDGQDLADGATVEHGNAITVKATAAAHYHFVGWSDGNKDAERTINVTKDINLTANFEIDTYTISINAKNGTIEGSGTYDYGASITLTAKPRNGYHFVGWSDGNTDNPRTITANEGLLSIITDSFTAIFEAGDATAVNEEEVAEVNIFAYGNTIVVENADSDILVYSAMGQLVNRTISNGLRDEIAINGTGIYIVKVGNIAKRVAIRN